jgi:hypothetical protein
MISNLYLFAAVLFRAGFSTGILPGLFLAAIVEAKYHRIAKFVEFLNRVSEDGLDRRGKNGEVSVSTPSPSPEKVWRVA